jgi:hypothetical protein
MRLRRKIVPSIFLLIALVAAWQMIRIHAAKQKRKNREAAYAAIAAELQEVIRPGMLRADAEAILRNRARPFTNRSGSRTDDDIIPLAHEPSPVWYCNYEQVQLLIEFAPAQTSPNQQPITPTGYQSLPKDRVKSVTLDHWLQDCM